MAASAETAITAKSLALTVDEQKELFLWKYKDIDRQEVAALLKDFKRFDRLGTGEIEEHEGLLLLESRGATMTATELRTLFSSIDVDKNRRISFLEWCCAVYSRSYEDLSVFADEAAKELAMAEAKEQEAKALAAEAEIIRAKEAEEMEKKRVADELEAESKLTGVAGMAAFFKRQVQGAQDSTATNALRITEEAARRRQLREAKEEYSKALADAMKIKTAEDVQREVQRKAKKEAVDAAAEAAKALAEEKRIRAERKAANEAKWGGGLPPPTPSTLKAVGASKTPAK